MCPVTEGIRDAEFHCRVYALRRFVAGDQGSKLSAFMVGHPAPFSMS
jgi:hypothetical protein